MTKQLRENMKTKSSFEKIFLPLPVVMLPSNSFISTSQPRGVEHTARGPHTRPSHEEKKYTDVRGKKQLCDRFL